MPPTEPLCDNCLHWRSDHDEELGCQRDDLEGRLCPCTEFEEEPI